jgi:CheY-like chemotaxis protein
MSLYVVMSARIIITSSSQLEQVKYSIMVKRSRSAAQLPDDTRADLVLDNIDLPIAQESPETCGVELIEATHQLARNRNAAAEVPQVVASASSSSPTTCALDESKRIRTDQATDQLHNTTLESVHNKTHFLTR